MVMKKWSIAAVAALISAVTGLQTTICAASTSDIKVTVNQAAVQFPDQKPVMDANRVLIPTRFVAQSLGGNVSYNSKTKMVTIQQGNETIMLKINSNKVTAGSKVVTLDVPAKVIQGRTMVPLRFVSEAMGATVDWQQANSLVAITTGSVQTPPTSQLQSTNTTDNFAFDPSWTTLAKQLFVNNIKEENGTVTFTLPQDATGSYYYKGITKLVPGKKYTYAIGKGQGAVIIDYVDKAKVIDGAQKQSESYVIYLDGAFIGKTTEGVYVKTDDQKLNVKIGTLHEVIELAKSF